MKKSLVIFTLTLCMLVTTSVTVFASTNEGGKCISLKDAKVQMLEQYCSQKCMNFGDIVQTIKDRFQNLNGVPKLETLNLDKPTCNLDKPDSDLAKPGSDLDKPEILVPNQDNPANDNSNTDQEESNEDYSVDLSSQNQELQLVNKERQNQGLEGLTINSEVNKLANIKAMDMAKNNYFSHTSPTYGSAFDMMNSNNVKYKTAGENIAMGQKTAAEVMNSWMNSSGHRANIMNPAYDQIGIGIAKDSNGRTYWVQMFIGQ